MTWLSFAAKSGGLLLVTPLVLHLFSPAQASLWLLFLTINAISQMADFGFGPSFVRAASYARSGRRTLDTAECLLAGPNKSLLREIYGVLGSCYDRLAIFWGIISLLLGSWALSKPIFELSDAYEGWSAWGVVWAASLVAFRNSGYAQWLQGMNQVALLRRVEAVLAIGTTAVTAAVLLITHDFIRTVAAAALGAVASSFVVRWLGRREAKSLSDYECSVSSSAVYAFVWPAAWRSGLGVLMSYGAIQASGIIYAQLVPAAQAAPYLLAMRILHALTQVSMAPFYSKLPQFSALYATGEQRALVEFAQRSMARAHWVYVAGVLLVGVFAERLLIAVGSQTSFISSPLWFLIGAAFFIERYGAMHLQLYSLSNHILWHVANGITGAIYLIASFFLLPALGAAAFPVGIIFGYAGYYSWFAARLSYRHFELNALKFESRAALMPFALLIAALLVSLLY